MKARISRTALLQALEAVEPGLSARATVEQSNNIVFKNGYVISYNEEVCCRMKGPLPEEFTAAVRGKPLLETVRRLTDDELTVTLTDSSFKLEAGQRSAAVVAEKEILLPYNAVKKPGEWKKLHEEFITALAMAAECAGKDESHFVMTCVRLSGKFVEACDNFQMLRFDVRLPITDSFLIHKTAARHAAAVGSTSVAHAEGWVHFKNQEGLILSCRRYDEQYPDLGAEFQKFKGRPAKFPGGTADAADFASVFSGENPDDNQVVVTFADGRMILSGEGVSGIAAHRFKFPKWKGPPLAFGISPKLLVSIIEKRRECEVSEDRLRAVGGSWTYMACLRKVQANGHAKESK